MATHSSKLVLHNAPERLDVPALQELLKASPAGKLSLDYVADKTPL